MDWVLTSQLVLLGFLFAASFLFSGSETAFFNLKKPDIQQLQQDLAPASRLVVRLLNRPQRLLVTLITGNTLINIGIALLSAVLTIRLAHRWHFSIPLALAIESLGVTGLLVVIGEVTPKVIALRRSVSFARKTARWVQLMDHLLAPWAVFLYQLVEKPLRKFGPEPETVLTSDEEIRTLAELGLDHGVIGVEEQEMIHSVIEFGDMVAREVMIPRTDMVMLHTQMTKEDVLKTIRESRFSKYPLYHKRVDDILGIIYIKDLLPYLHSSVQHINLRRLARPALFVPEKQDLESLLREMQQKRQKVALVVDEYGGISGLVAIEDIIEEVLGDIRDEIDRQEPVPFKQISDKVYLVAAATRLEEITEKLGIPFPEERDYDTLGGFVFAHFGRIPEAGAIFQYEGWRFQVQAVKEHRITRIKLRKIGKPAKEQDGR